MGGMRSRVTEVVREFKSVDLGDERREKRLRGVVRKLANRPDVSFPRAMKTEADLEGFYRFLANESVTPEALLQPHVQATIERASAQAEILIVHDASQFTYSTERNGLGRLNRSGHGFVGHLSVAVTSDAKHGILGTIGFEIWNRHGDTPTALVKQGKISSRQAREMPNEQDLWLRGVHRADAAIARRTSPIHVMDSEADDYDLMADLVEERHRWILRLGYDRLLCDQPIHALRKTKAFMESREIVCTRDVHVSAHKRPPGGGDRRSRPREAREATLAISASQLVFRRPADSHHPVRRLAVNVVSVREVDPPKGVEPIEWLLATTEPIENEEQILKIVDCYRGRWRIEEFFKALKTGCGIEKRQLESVETIEKAVALFIPIAWSLLHLRTVARHNGADAASSVLTPIELKVLARATKTKLSSTSTARDAMLAVARLGGHHRSNGDPGWQLLGRGYQDLLMLVAGYRLAGEK
jgi:transposase-like protein/DDE family transposase